MAEYRIEPKGFLNYLAGMNRTERAEKVIDLATKMVEGKQSKAKWLTKIRSKSNKSNNDYSESFLEFWQAYPRKVGKGAAFAVWVGLGMDSEKESTQQVTEALRWQVLSKSWTDGFIPLPETYLRQRRFEDEPDKPAKVKLRKVYG